MNRDQNKLAEILGGIPILEILPGSPAHQAGVQAGDILLSVNGQPTPTMNEYIEASALDSKERTRTMEVWRNGKILNLTIQMGAPLPPQARESYLHKYLEGESSSNLN